MENEAQLEQSDNREQSVAHDETKVQAQRSRSSWKTILLTVVISVITIGSLAILRGQVDSPQQDAAVVEHNVVTLDKMTANESGADIDGMFETIGRSIESLSERISQWFDALKADHSSVNHELSGIAISMNAIHESIAELRKGNKELNQRIDAAQSRLQAIARDVSGLRIAAKNKVAKQRTHTVEMPPFHIDAIDLWDAVVYVAISQNGLVAFLREGGQRSGWTVTHIDRVKGQVAFRGPAGQDYSASLRR